MLRWHLQRLDQFANRGKPQLAISPFQMANPGKPTVFDSRRDLRLYGWRAAGNSESATVTEATGASGYLGQFIWHQVSDSATVELGQSGKGDVVDVQVEPHADGIGSNEAVDFAVLVHGDLGVSGPRTEGTHDDGCPSPPLPDAFGNVVNVLDRETDDG